MKINKTGIVTDKIIKEAIAKEYDVKTKDVTVHYNSRNEFVKYSFTKDEGGKFLTKSDNTLEDEELQTIIRNILHSEKISYHTLKPKFEHTPGDSMKQMDYGSIDYIGFGFTYAERGQ